MLFIYDKELDMALESAYDDGYVQALMDMGINPDDIVEEDVDMFDDNYFDEAMEGNPENKAKRRKWELKNGVINGGYGREIAYLSDDTLIKTSRRQNNKYDPRYLPRRRHHDGGMWRDIELKQHGAVRDHYYTKNRPLERFRETVPNDMKKEHLRNWASGAYKDTGSTKAGSRAIHNTSFTSRPRKLDENGDYVLRTTSKSRW